MQASDTTSRLAHAADVLSDQLRDHLERFALLVAPAASVLDHQFSAVLTRSGTDAKQRAALLGITPGAAARLLASGLPPARFFEQVEYSGRRLAKLNLSPSSVISALQAYDRLLSRYLSRAGITHDEEFHWVREQLHFCAVLTLNNAFYQVREAETKAFYDLFRAELEARGLDDLLVRFLGALSSFCQSDEAHLYLLDTDTAEWVPRASVFRGRRQAPATAVPKSRARRKLLKPRCVKLAASGDVPLDASWSSRFHSCWSMPLAVQGRITGVMQFAFAREYAWLPRERELLAAAAERCVDAAEKAKLMEELASSEEQIRRLAEHMLHVEEVERRRISRELHDEAGQSLLCIRLQLEMVEQSLPDSQADARNRLAGARRLTEHTILEIRRLIAALSPSVLQQIGLGAALRQLVTRFREVYPARVKLHIGRIASLPKQTEVIVYRLVQECCNNIAKHSSASAVNISVHAADSLLRLEVEDNGVGFKFEEAMAKQNSFGLAGIRERVALLGGTFRLESRPAAAGRRQSGTKVFIELPVREAGDTGAGAELQHVLAI